MAGHDVNGHQPGLQGQVAAVHDRARGHRSLLPAGRTFPARPATLQFPAPVMAAGGADEAVGPALGCEMPSAGGFIGKARLEGGAGHRAVVFPAAGHDRTLGEHSADGNRKPNMSSNRVQRDKPYTNISKPRDYSTSSASKRTRFSSGTLPICLRDLSVARPTMFAVSTPASAIRPDRGTRSAVSWPKWSGTPASWFLASVSSSLICRAPNQAGGGVL